MPLKNVRYVVVTRKGRRFRLAIDKTTGKAKEVKAMPKAKRNG
jgi:hypothetical protein